MEAVVLPIYGFSIEKTTLFRVGSQPFANVYYYTAGSIAPTQNVDLEILLDQIVAKEKEFHGSAVNFVRGRCWNTGSGSPETNLMRVDKTLTGTGALSNDTSMDRERAILVQIRAGINTKGRPVYLRKWYHVCAAPPPGAFTAGMIAQTSELTTAQRDYYAGKVNDIQELELATVNVAQMCAKSGRQTTAEPVTHRWLEHHQLGDKWRSN